MDNKTKGALVALVGSLCLGGAQLMDMESRIAALEEAAGIEPEPAEAEPDPEDSKETKSAPEAAEEPESIEEE
tara:strand:+ start:496 stop:714 length:219 start_codon:yes stop_codon:yes gene_type:complete